MALEIPIDLEQALQAYAAKRQSSVEAVIREALDWYLRIEAETIDELAAWQEVRDEAVRLIEDASP